MDEYEHEIETLADRLYEDDSAEQVENAEELAELARSTLQDCIRYLGQRDVPRSDRSDVIVEAHRRALYRGADDQAEQLRQQLTAYQGL